MEFAVFQFELVAKDELRLPRYKGSAFRGLLGHALKRTVCVTRMDRCDGCLLRQDCVYAYIFETFNKRGERVARPFVLEPPLLERRIFPEGDSMLLQLILFGKAVDYIPYLIHTFREMGRMGLGANRGRFWLRRVTYKEKIIYHFEEQALHTDFERENLFSIKADGQTVEKAKIRFITPTAIKQNGQLRKDIDFVSLLKAVKRRIKALSIYHNGHLSDELYFDLDKAQSVSVNGLNLAPFAWKRYSNRQKQKIDLSGFVGEMELRGDLTSFIPLLRMGEIIHIGRGTVYGMGKYLVDIIKD